MLILYEKFIYDYFIMPVQELTKLETIGTNKFAWMIADLERLRKKTSDEVKRLLSMSGV